MSNHLENILALSPNIIELMQHSLVLDLMEPLTVDCFIDEVVASANSALEVLLKQGTLTEDEMELIELAMDNPKIVSSWQPETIDKFKRKAGIFVPDEDEEEYGKSERDDWEDEDFAERMRSFR